MNETCILNDIEFKRKIKTRLKISIYSREQNRKIRKIGQNMKIGEGLCEAGLCGAGLCEEGLCEAGLCGVGLCGAGLCEAGLCGTRLCGAGLGGAGLCGVGPSKASEASLAPQASPRRP